MGRKNTKIESIFKTEDEKERKKAILDGLLALIEKEIVSSVQTQALAHLQKR